VSQLATADDELLDGARRAVSKYGWRDATLERIAREAGLSRVTLHRRGVSKAAILRGLAEAYELDYRTALVTAVEAGRTGGERLRLALDAMCDVSERHLETIVALADDASAVFFHDPGEAATSKEFIVAPLRTILAGGARDGTLLPVDPDEWATVIANLMHWTYQHLRQSHAWSPERSRRTLIQIVVEGVEARRPERTR
jgi:AcrR family transcriptional regulator